MYLFSTSRCEPRSRKKIAGVTLSELLVTLAISAVMAAFAAPNLMLFVRTSAVKGVTTELAASINYARSEAIKRGLPVTVCRSGNIQEANPTCSTVTNWNQGWLTFLDVNQDGTVGPNDIRLRVGRPSSDTVSIASNGNNFANRVTYFSTGRSNSPGCFDIQSQNIQRSIVISASGRLRIAGEAC